MKGDHVARIICEHYNLRIYTALTADLARTITGQHKTSPAATLALGRAINATALLCAALKPSSAQSVTLRISGTGPIREIHVQADAKGNIRGYVANPAVEPVVRNGAIDIPAIIGAGFLTVVKDLGLKEPYSSVIPLHTGEIARDCAYYLTESEQVPSAMIIGLALKSDGTIAGSGGILVQRFPDTADTALERVETNIAGMKNPLGESLRRGEDIISVVSRLMDDQPLSLLSTNPIRAACRCNREMIGEIIQGIDGGEIEEMLDKDHGIELRCTFCTKNYHYDEIEVRALLDR
ncbi:MAG TPA: Hsp33 family molecular chaperone HslO [Spirochaetota bacterium]|nr:Hsp33 family molecular chaperone HslO [Spirochaetota bacterium]